jgi:hypothetical protein
MQPLSEGEPLAYTWVAPVVPERRELPAGELAYVPSVNLSGPLPLPMLASPVRESFSSDEATNDFSLAAALAATPPARSNPAPFLRLTIPDPFENRPATRLAVELAESAMPVTATPQVPSIRGK